jgi:acyl carrier protein
MREKIKQDLSRIFSLVFGEAVPVDEGTTARDIRQWNSLNHIRLISEVEKFYGIGFSFQEARSFRTVGDLINAIIAHTSC